MFPTKFINVFPLFGHIDSIAEMLNNYTENFHKIYQLF